MAMETQHSKKAGDDSQELIDTVVPSQRIGGQSNVDIPYHCSSEAVAETVYEKLKILMLNVNEWHRYIDGVSAYFTVTDKDGEHFQERPIVGNHFKIRIPGPALKLGGGYDWITVADKQEIKKGEAAVFYMTAVPSCNPTNDRPEIAHFLQKEASTTFIALKEGPLIRMLIRSRNEVPNVHVGGWQDRMRNRMVGFFAAIYLSRFQWTRLARALLGVAVKGGHQG